MPGSAHSEGSAQDATLLLRGSAEHAPAAKAFELRVIFGSNEARISLGQQRVLLGRDVETHGHRLADPYVSRCHVQLDWDERMGAHRLTDMGTINGTYVNGGRIKSRCLEHGDVVRLGETLFLYQDSDTTSASDEVLSKVARREVTVLVCGETGSGKERCARALHELSQRPGPFVPLNCAALPSALILSELFGHVKGAFSGAGTPRAGLFLSANRGTLFLDEIGELPLELQATLLRTLQERRVRAVGSDREVPVDVRVVAATHVDLTSAVGERRFRADLHARLAEFTVFVPPLRARRHEILPALDSELRGQDTPKAWTADAAEALLLWQWPYNFRDLQALARYLSISTSSDVVTLEHLRGWRAELGAGLRDRAALPNVGAAKQPGPRERLQRALVEHRGNISAVARELQKPRSQIYRWMRTYGLRQNRSF